MGAVRPERSALRGSASSSTSCCCCWASQSAAWDLVLLHTNDVHARVEETSKHSGKCGSRGGCLAGVARRATAVERIRSSERNRAAAGRRRPVPGQRVVQLLQRSRGCAFHEHNCATMPWLLEIMSSITEWTGLMKPFMQEIKCPVLSANIKPDQTLASTFGKSYLPYKILTVGGERVGVVGYTSQETPDLSNSGPHLDFEDEVSSLQLQVDKLQTLGVNKIIALGHSGFTVDQQIAKKVRGVDVVIGGHTNTFLYTGTPPSSEVPAGPYPFMVRSLDGRQVPVVQAYAFGKYLGHLKVTFDDAGNVMKSTGNPILLDSSIPQGVEKNLANYSAQVVGETLVFLNGTTEECRFRECNLGNLICDAMTRRRSGTTSAPAIYNGGGVRTSIDEHTRNGSITMEDLLSVLPFGGTFDLAQMKGSTLRKAFEYSVKRYGQSTGEFLQVSGIHVEYDLSKPPGRRVKSLSILCTKCRVPQYEPVQDEMVYTVVLPSYIVAGGDGFSMLKNETLKHNSGEFGRSDEFLPPSRDSSFHFTSFVPFQVIWTFQSCPSSSRKGRRFIRLLKDASRSTTQPLDKLLHWFYWFHWDFCGLCEGACKADSAQKPDDT
ncbi:Snake venom 5'-nucleotidase [Nibea albiflora]|uniref:Snake venom 5'-nucleotidase n=1 Tax=Nibea albiflora TaxID=240163 RepID=A0ACB7FC97_NIBAL|nr:Snake venom 5'-nucleotidase [Nibea albiflora]